MKADWNGREVIILAALVGFIVGMVFGAGFGFLS